MSRQVVILGAGISGLSCAWALKKKYGSEVAITIIEKSHRAGGWVQTIHQDSFLFELGPHSFRGSAEHLWQLIEELGLQDQIIQSDPSARQRYLYSQQKLQVLPYSFLSLLTSPYLFSLVGAMARDLWMPKGTHPDESVEDFFTRRFGGFVANQFADPLVSGIFAGDSRRLSMKACFPKLHQSEQEHRSVLKGMLSSKKKVKRGIFSFKEGMETLPQEIVNQLDAKILYRAEPSHLTSHPDHIQIQLSNGKVIEADQVISTIPLYALNHLISMPSLPYATVTVVNVGYNEPVLKQQGFGYLIPRQEQESILGCIWDSNVFPQQSRPHQTRLTVMLNESTVENAKAVSFDALQRHLNIKVLPASTHITIAKHAIPQYVVGYAELKQSIYHSISSIPRLQLLGTAFNGVSINDCVQAVRY